jgi:brefeldin A-resistance guanine nucleotide exchange factor 1
MPHSSVVFLVNSLLSELPETSPVVIVVKPERPAAGPSRPGTGKIDSDKPSYNPGIVYVLELATILTLRDGKTIQDLGESLTASLQNVVRDAKNLHPLTVSRVVYYLLNLLRLSYVGH